jgi:hypothetical protein
MADVLEVMKAFAAKQAGPEQVMRALGEHTEGA